MGIAGINTFIKKYAPDAYFNISISKFRGKRIAIDGNYWMYVNMAIARKKVINKTDVAVQEPNQNDIRREWFLLAINFIMIWTSYNITPIFVFDGKHPPEKQATKTKRKENRESHKTKVEAIYKQLNDATDILDKPIDLIEQLRKELRNYNHINSEDFELFQIFLKGIGIPCYTAQGDGEKLCSMFCLEEQVAAVYSSDTDTLVYGCPLIITKFSDTYSYNSDGEREPHLECVRLDLILHRMNVSHKLYVDLCIMSGCDYNTNIPGIGPAKSFKLLEKFRTIENIPLDTQCLNYQRCRELFRIEPFTNLIVKDDPESEISFDIDKTAIAQSRDYFELVQLDGQIHRILSIYEQISPSSPGYIEDLQLRTIKTSEIPKLKLKITSNHTPTLKLNIVSN